MKVFVWVNPYGVNYGTSMVFAIAEDEDAARAEAAKGAKWDYSEFHNEKWNGATIALGTPDRVLDLPCAEWHEWSE